MQKIIENLKRQLEVEQLEGGQLRFSIASDTPYRRVMDGQAVDEILVISNQSIDPERFDDRKNAVLVRA